VARVLVAGCALTARSRAWPPLNYLTGRVSVTLLVSNFRNFGLNRPKLVAVGSPISEVKGPAFTTTFVLSYLRGIPRRRRENADTKKSYKEHPPTRSPSLGSDDRPFVKLPACPAAKNEEQQQEQRKSDHLRSLFPGGAEEESQARGAKALAFGNEGARDSQAANTRKGVGSGAFGGEVQPDGVRSVGCRRLQFTEMERQKRRRG
jgi:hypothetical protein